MADWLRLTQNKLANKLSCPILLYYTLNQVLSNLTHTLVTRLSNC